MSRRSTRLARFLDKHGMPQIVSGKFRCRCGAVQCSAQNRTYLHSCAKCGAPYLVLCGGVRKWMRHWQASERTRRYGKPDYREGLHCFECRVNLIEGSKWRCPDCRLRENTRARRRAAGNS